MPHNNASKLIENHPPIPHTGVVKIQIWAVHDIASTNMSGICDDLWGSFIPSKSGLHIGFSWFLIGAKDLSPHGELKLSWLGKRARAFQIETL